MQIFAGVLAASFLLLAPAGPAHATRIFTNQIGFVISVDEYFVDDYSDPGYLTGDIATNPYYARHSDAHLSNVVGETSYRSTAGPSNEIFFTTGSGPGTPPFYCAWSCTSFELDFTSTSYGNSSGVYGVGFRILRNNIDSGGGVALPYVTVTFGSGLVANYALEEVSVASAFWGITSGDRISRLHVGGLDGAPVPDENFESFYMDNLIIASPEPGSFVLLGGGLLALGLRRRAHSRA